MTDTDRPDLRWLLAGALGGLLIAAAGLLERGGPADALPEGAVARVNGAVITEESLDSAASRLGLGAAGNSERAALLRRLVDDELLVQRGLELGMVRTDPAVRSAIVESMIASVTAESDAADPDDETLERHLHEFAERFSYVSGIAAGAWQSDDEALAQAFVGELRNSGNAPLMDGVAPVPDLPQGLAPLDEWRGPLGPGITAAIADMPAGASAVFARRGRWLVVEVREQAVAAIDDLSAVRSRVLLDYRREAARRALDDYIAGLEARGDVTIAQ